MPQPLAPVLILGAGINGAALARELALNGVPVRLVDVADAASGTTSYSSRLIHGGLRYLEYGEFDLVRESLAERMRWLRLAPQFVWPLRLLIPVANRWGGLWASAKRFLGLRGRRANVVHRGLWAIRWGLRLYDLYARDPSLPGHRVHRAREAGLSRIDRAHYRWLCEYSDAQIMFPERFTLALIEDARRAARSDAPCEVHTYHRTMLDGRRVTISPLARPSEVTASWEPSAIVNATGAWVDHTLSQLAVPSKKLIGGTKGSHFFTSNARLRTALTGYGIYAEAADGRPFFVLPFGSSTLVGTTDEKFDGDPGDAAMTPQELEYLIGAVNEVLPEARLTAADVDLHYSGVRPLPHNDGGVTAAITRRHWLEPNPACPVPLYSIVGGKLTTCRSLAEEATGTLLARLGRERVTTSQDRALPGAEDYPGSAAELVARIRQLADQSQLTVEQVQAVWALCGTRTAEIVSGLSPAQRASLADTSLPLGLVHWVLRHEFPRTLDDLIERRLMLLYHPRLTRACLQQLAELLVEAHLLPRDAVEASIQATIERLRTRFGKQVFP